jgi:hypothetical protein
VSKLPPSSKEPWGLSASESDHPHREPDGLGRGFLLLAILSPCYSDLDPKSKDTHDVQVLVGSIVVLGRGNSYMTQRFYMYLMTQAFFFRHSAVSCKCSGGMEEVRARVPYPH